MDISVYTVYDGNKRVGTGTAEGGELKSFRHGFRYDNLGKALAKAVERNLDFDTQGIFFSGESMPRMLKVYRQVNDFTRTPQEDIVNADLAKLKSAGIKVEVQDRECKETDTYLLVLNDKYKFERCDFVKLFVPSGKRDVKKSTLFTLSMGPCFVSFSSVEEVIEFVNWDGDRLPCGCPVFAEAEAV